jgi:hypothetical protein
MCNVRASGSPWTDLKNGATVAAQEMQFIEDDEADAANVATLAPASGHAVEFLGRGDYDMRGA